APVGLRRVHPAPSIILFTTLSGLGYGMLFWLGLLTCGGWISPDPAFGAASSMLALGFVTAGLLSSTLHLGHKERAWRALSQWRSSWLSREGVAALVTFVPMVALAWLLWRSEAGAALRIAAAALAACAMLTVGCTARIYTSLKTIPAWHNALVLPAYLLFALLG